MFASERNPVHHPAVAAHPFHPRSPLCESHAEEMASMWTHLVGVLLAIAALCWMLLSCEPRVLHQVSAAVFGTSLVLLYLASSLYHACRSPRVKSLFQFFDHACIYLLIAGSYTPLTLVTLKGAWGWSIFGVIWFLAIGGILLKTFIKGRKEAAWSTALYLAMGWIIVVAAHPLIQSLPPAGLAWLVAGGIFYSLGIIFFVWTRLPFHHAVWHGFVMLGSCCHVIATSLHILS